MRDCCSSHPAPANTLRRLYSQPSISPHDRRRSLAALPLLLRPFFPLPASAPGRILRQASRSRGDRPCQSSWTSSISCRSHSPAAPNRSPAGPRSVSSRGRHARGAHFRRRGSPPSCPSRNRPLPRTSLVIPAEELAVGGRHRHRVRAGANRSPQPEFLTPCRPARAHLAFPASTSRLKARIL